MRNRKTMKAAFALMAALSGISDQALAEKAPKHRNPKASVVETFVFVPSDAVLRQVGQSRAQYNAANPRAEKEWRKAWAVKGTPNDNGHFELIRTQSAAPKDKAGEGN